MPSMEAAHGKFVMAMVQVSLASLDMIKITIGNGISLENYPFGITKEQARGYARDPFLDGLFSLAFPIISAINNMTSTSFVQDLYAHGKIKEPIISFWLGRSAADNGQGEVVND